MLEALGASVTGLRCHLDANPPIRAVGVAETLRSILVHIVISTGLKKASDDCDPCQRSGPKNVIGPVMDCQPKLILIDEGFPDKASLLESGILLPSGPWQSQLLNGRKHIAMMCMK